MTQLPNFGHKLTNMTDLDPAQVVELEALELQKPMNSVIDRGDSPIQQLYNDTTVFITGGCGFIGKHLIEKLFRACNIKKIFVLVRPKKNKTIQERIEATLSNPVYDTLRKKKPNFAERVVPIQGDVSDLRLGLSDKDWKFLTEQVNIIFHEAATIRFNEPLRTATITNVRGTREVLQLARECKNLVQFVHVSTTFAQATKENINKDIFEEFSPCPVPPHTLISLAENVEENRLNSITNKFIDGWNNTYTFTKAVAEELVRTSASNLPVCIIRPPMVIPAYYEPTPGWLDSTTVMGPSGLTLVCSLGVMHVCNLDVKVKNAQAPIDFVNNATIAAVWDSVQRRKAGDNNIPIYTVAKKETSMTFEFIENTLRDKCGDIYTPKAVWLCGGYNIKNYYLYAVMSFFLHYIPAYLLDVVLYILGKKLKEFTSVVDVYRKVDKSLQAYDYFQRNEWYFHDHNVQAMLKKMTPADQVIFNCDLTTIDFSKYYVILAIGIRKYIIQDGLQGSAEGARRQFIFRILNYVVCPLYIYLLWLIFSAIFKLFAYIFV